MDEHTRHSSELAKLDSWDRTFWLSRSYLEASVFLCEGMIGGEFSAQYSSSRVVLHLSRHGIELFLKAAITAKGSVHGKLGHDLDSLWDAYWHTYPEQTYFFEIPKRFLVSPTRSLFPKDVKPLLATMDQRDRYAEDLKGTSFASPEVFEPSVVVKELKNLSSHLALIEWTLIRPLVST